jgi:DNA-binding HxlR family transcriptional regulator
MQVTKSRSKRTHPDSEDRRFLRSPCAVACTLDVIGDKWSLLVIRDLFRGLSTYKELQNSPEGIPTNILADRLKRLEEAGLIAKTAYQQHPVRFAYSLTEKGKSLREVLGAFARWGQANIAGTRTLGRPAESSSRDGRRR